VVGTGDLPKEIPDERLRVDAIPSNSAPWKTIERFALTMNGYRVIGDEEVGKLANRVKSDFEQNQRSLGKLTPCWMRFGAKYQRLRARNHQCDLFPSNSRTMPTHSASNGSLQTGLPARLYQ
jgi:hypothetical protein